MSMTDDQAETLAELIDQQPQRQAQRSVYLEGENERARRRVRRAVRARARHPVSPAEARRETRRQADPLPRQQRAVPRRVLGRQCSAASCRCRWRSASATSTTQAAAHREKLGKPFIYTDRKIAGSHRRLRGHGRRAGHVRRPRARAPSSSTTSTTSRAPARCIARQAGRHGVHPVLLGLDQRAEGRGAHARATSSRTRAARARPSQFERGRRQSLLDAADPRHGPDRHAHHHVREPHAAAT